VTARLTYFLLHSLVSPFQIHDLDLATGWDTYTYVNISHRHDRMCTTVAS
jgi:hypothetical protein